MRQKTYFSVLEQLILFTILLVSSPSFGQEKLIKIEGFAPSYVGKEISVHQITDFWTDREAKLGSAQVEADSSFSIQFYASETQKVKIRVLNNYGWMYIEPGSNYSIFVPENNPYEAVVKSGMQLEIAFFDLEPTDINYKILSFNRWNDDFLQFNLRYKNSDPAKFAGKLDTFKLNVEKAYKLDTSIFFLTYVKFSMAELDEIEFAGSRNRYEKFDFYLKKSPVFYQNDAYMNYVKKYYKNMLPRLSNEANNEVYLGVLKSSPTLVMKALGSEYSLSNLRLRELIMMQALSEVFYSDDFPQTNILQIFDSLSKKALFKENREIANNLTFRITELVPGAKAPEFVLLSPNKKALTHLDFRGKYLYLHFYDPKSPSNQLELTLLKDLHRKYMTDIQFVTIALDNGDLTDKEIAELDNLNWLNFRYPSKDDLMQKFKVQNFPTYFLIDVSGYLAQSPALAPTPNSLYQTIEKTFFSIQKINREIRER